MEVTVKNISRNSEGKLVVWTCEYEAPFRLKKSNPNYNYIYDNIQTGKVYNVKLRYCVFYNELMNIAPVKTTVKVGKIKNICSLHLEFKWLKDYKEIVVKNSKKRFILSNEECDVLQIGTCYSFEYQKKYDNLYLITKI